MRKPKLTEAKPWTLLRSTSGNPKLIGYARVSTREQNLDSQLVRLRELQCCRIYAEKVSGASGSRPGWEALLSELRAGDQVCVVRIDRMGRKLSELVKSIEAIRELGAHVRSVEESIDTSQRGGRFAFDMVSVFAQKVRDDISENTRAGLRAAKLRGRVLGRPRKLEPAKIAHVSHLRSQGFSLREIGRATGLGKTTVETALKLAAALRGDPRQMQLTGTEAP
jgi:DNA invertase Pin-like site-specific DNA recombinase